MSSNQKRFTDQQIETANGTNLIAYARSRGYDLKRISNNSYKIPGYGGLFISGDGSKWNWFSQNKGGGAIQFVMEMEGKSWMDAVKVLLGITHDELPNIPSVTEIKPKVKMILPEKNDTYKHLFAYLIKARNIDKEVVADFVERKFIYEDKYKNCVFVGYDDNHEPAYASVRSARTVGKVFRGDVKNSDKSVPFYYPGTSNTVCVFEAPIDLMSYLSLLKGHGIDNFNHHLISLGGVSDKGLKSFLKQLKGMSTIMLCLDNDQAGDEACLEIYEKYCVDYKILRHKPIHKDFNEDLCQVKKEMSLTKAREPFEDYLDGDSL